MKPQEKKGPRLASQKPGTPASKACVIPLPRNQVIQRQRRQLSSEVGDLGCALSSDPWAVGLRVGLSPLGAGRGGEGRARWGSPGHGTLLSPENPRSLWCYLMTSFLDVIEKKG